MKAVRVIVGLLALEAAALGVLVAADRVAGTRWAVWFALAILPVFGVTAIPRRQRP